MWWREKVIVEVDGYGPHSTRTAFRSDRRRDNELRLQGFTVIRVTNDQLEDTPKEVLVWISTALTRSQR